MNYILVFFSKNNILIRRDHMPEGHGHGNANNKGLGEVVHRLGW